MAKDKHLNLGFTRRVAESLRGESDRACLVLVASWADHILRIKISRQFEGGNKKARKALFSPNGPFSTFFSKITFAFCAGWIERDIYKDLQLIRKMRNEVAHSIEPHDLNDPEYSARVKRLQVPKRFVSDWTELRAASTADGVVLFTSEKPEDADDELKLAKLRFRLAASLLIATLAGDMEIPLWDESTGSFFILDMNSADEAV